MFYLSNCGKKLAEACFRKKHAFCHFALFSFIILTSISTVHAKEQALDVALVLDTSGSMKSTDPQQLRSQAAKLFIQLLDRKDRVSLVSFSNRAYPVTQFLSLDAQKNEQLLFRAIDKLTSTGQYTNLHDALLRGYELLTQKSNNSKGRTIILMSDGKMDLGSESRNLRLLEKTLDDLTPKLAAENIIVHTIAFTDQSYIPLLKLAAEDTGGEFILLNNDQGTHQVFERLFERTKIPEMLPIKEDNFVVDKAIHEITIVASKFRPNSFVSLESPDGTEINSENYASDIKWFNAKKYDLITIKNPTPGYWLVKYTEGGNKVYLLSNINLVIESTKKTSEPGTPLHIQAYLTKNDKKINSRAILNNVHFLIKATSPEGSEIENVMLDDGSEIGSERKDGIYGISYAFDLEGSYKVEVSAIGQTFDRIKNSFINVKSSSPQKPFIKMRDEKIEEKLVESTESIKNTDTESHQEAQTNNPIISEDGTAKEHQDSEEKEDTQHEDPIEDKHAETSDGHSNDGETHENTSSHDSTIEGESNIDGNSIIEGESNGENQSEEETSFRFAIITFIIFNLLLAAIGGAYYYYTKRKKGKVIDTNKDNDSQNNGKKSGIEGEKDTMNSDSIQTTETDESNNSLSSLSELDLDDELSSILESNDDNRN